MQLQATDVALVNAVRQTLNSPSAPPMAGKPDVDAAGREFVVTTTRPPRHSSEARGAALRATRDRLLRIRRQIGRNA